MDKEELFNRIEEEYDDFLDKQSFNDAAETVARKMEISFYGKMYNYFSSGSYADLPEEQLEALDAMGEYPLAYMFQEFQRKCEGFEFLGRNSAERVSILLDKWTDAYKSAELGDIEGIKAFVRFRVENEYEHCKTKIAGLSPIDIMDCLGEVHFYSGMKDYICDEEGENRLEDVQYRALFEEQYDIISCLYEECKETGNKDLNKNVSLHDIICNYNEKYHQEVLGDRAGLSPKME